MRSLEICTQRIFNSLIQQNQILASDFVLKQSTIVRSAQRPASKVWRPTSTVQRPASRAYRPRSSIQSPASRVQRLVSSVQSPEFSIQSPASRVERAKSSVQRPESNVQSPVSNSCVLGPWIPVCRFWGCFIMYLKCKFNIKNNTMKTLKYLL